MTVKFRNGILRTLFILGIIFFVGEFAVLAVHFQKGLLKTSVKTLQYWWFFSRPVNFGEETFPWVLVSIMIIALVSLIMSAVVGTLFKNSISGEIFFFRLFLGIIPFHLLRFFNPLFSDIYPAYFPPAFFTRVDLFVFLLAVSSLFSASLIFLGIKGDKMKLILVLYTLICLGAVALFPINTTELTSLFLHKLTEENTLAVIFIFLAILSVINYLTRISGAIGDHALRLAGINVMIFIGYSFLYFGAFILLIPGTVFLIVGLILYSKEKYKKDLWSSY